MTSSSSYCCFVTFFHQFVVCFVIVRIISRLASRTGPSSGPSCVIPTMLLCPRDVISCSSPLSQYCTACFAIFTICYHLAATCFVVFPATLAYPIYPVRIFVYTSFIFSYIAFFLFRLCLIYPLPLNLLGRRIASRLVSFVAQLSTLLYCSLLSHSSSCFTIQLFCCVRLVFFIYPPLRTVDSQSHLNRILRSRSVLVTSLVSLLYALILCCWS